MFFLGMVGHAASAATSAASSASAAASTMPKGLDLLEKAMDLTEEATQSKEQEKEPPKNYRDVLMERAMTAGKGMEMKMAQSQGSMSLQVAEKVVTGLKESLGKSAEALSHKHDMDDSFEARKRNQAALQYKPNLNL